MTCLDSPNLQNPKYSISDQLWRSPALIDGCDQIAISLTLKVREPPSFEFSVSEPLISRHVSSGSNGSGLITISKFVELENGSRPLSSLQFYSIR
jgi:hypothetical protein